MSCNGCRILRKGCSEACILRACIEWIQSGEAQANATLFVAKFFGRADLMSFISAVPNHQRPALFQSLLFEACGRTVNPVNGAVGLLSSGNWHICEAAVDTVLRGGILRPIPPQLLPRAAAPPPPVVHSDTLLFHNVYGIPYQLLHQPMRLLNYDVIEEGPHRMRETTPLGSEASAITINCGENDRDALGGGIGQERKLLNLFI
ncbi:unnamed protein product [Amaranthus hypochondriacus]